MYNQFQYNEPFYNKPLIAGNFAPSHHKTNAIFDIYNDSMQCNKIMIDKQILKLMCAHKKLSLPLQKWKIMRQLKNGLMKDSALYVVGRGRNFFLFILTIK